VENWGDGIKKKGEPRENVRANRGRTVRTGLGSTFAIAPSHLTLEGRKKSRQV